jgi:SAM-dependent methyltransferase
MNKETDIISLNRKAWINVAEKYNNSKYDSINPLVDIFCRELPINGSILDLGSGTGVPFARLFVEKGFNYYGIDISPQMIEIARKNVPLANFKEMSMTDLDFNNRFDGVFSSYSMLLLSPELLESVARKVIRCLRNGGLFYISLNEPRSDNVDPDKDVICEIMGEKMYSRAYTETEILEVFSSLKHLKTFRGLLKSEEFGIEHMLVMLFKKDG